MNLKNGKRKVDKELVSSMMNIITITTTTTTMHTITMKTTTMIMINTITWLKKIKMPVSKIRN